MADQDRRCQRPAALLGQQLGAVRFDEHCQLCLELIRLAVQAADLRDLFARDPDPRAGRQPPQGAVEPVEHAPWLDARRLIERSSSGLSSRCQRSRFTVRVRWATRSPR